MSAETRHYRPGTHPRGEDTRQRLVETATEIFAIHGYEGASTRMLAERAGVDGTTLLATLAKGSADSFALRNHATKAMLPGIFPERAFSAEYALKDLSYALELAEASGLDLRGAELARNLLESAVARGDGGRYWPVIARLLEGRR